MLLIRRRTELGVPVPGKAERIERLIDLGAASLLSIACAYCASMTVSLAGPAKVAIAVSVAGLAFAAALGLLGRQGRASGAKPSAFDVIPLPDFPKVELLELGPDDEWGERFESRVKAELALGEVPETVDSGSRVVQIFDAREHSTAGELALRIERHIARRDSAQVADASAELVDALNKIRQGLR